jgi:imidazoleglycerol phosphate synthase glutamine amidotransferase subunit HisH
MAASVMRDAAKPAVGEKQHLVFPGVGAQRPAMTENHRHTRAQSL